MNKEHWAYFLAGAGVTYAAVAMYRRRARYQARCGGFDPRIQARLATSGQGQAIPMSHAYQDQAAQDFAGPRRAAAVASGVPPAPPASGELHEAGTLGGERF